MLLVELWIEYATLSLNRTFTYACFDETAVRGKRAEVIFNGRKCVGFIEKVTQTELSLQEASEKLGFKLGIVEKILDAYPLINEELFEMAKWLSYQTVSSRISCFQAMLPSKLKPASTNHKIKTEKWVRIKENSVELILSSKQKEAFNHLMILQKLKLTEWRKQFKSVGKALEDKGLVEQYDEEVLYQQKEVLPSSSSFVLTDTQQKAINQIHEAKTTTVLLHGVTGSGKTEVYLQMAKSILDQRKQVLILVPEIGLTPQMVKRVEDRFGANVAIYHSGLNNQEKYEQFIRVKNKEVDVVVGTRSAIFMPFENLGLIILDEEHDSSYKQDSTPQYHCRDVAIWRANYHGCKVILGSATPSLDSYARALKKVYTLVEMPVRVNEKMPKVIAVDIKEAVRNQESYVLSDKLKEKIKERLAKHEQVMLMLNRRGYSPTVRCNDCTTTIRCPHCDLALAWHRSENMLKCHCCGYVQPMVKECPQCHSTSLSMLGIGTQRLQEEVQNAFPDAKVDRMDADTTSLKNAHQKILQRLENHETDILVGTQIIAKGIDFPDVTLVGIINGDAGLNRTDFSSVETTFQLIVQAAGRSGRAEKSGEVIIQAYQPNHYAIQYGIRQDYLGFFQREMKYRHLSSSPPYSYMVSMVFSNQNQNCSVSEAHQAALWLKQSELRVLGPSELFKLQDYYRTRILLKGKDKDELIRAAHRCIENCIKHKMKSRIKVDTHVLMLE